MWYWRYIYVHNWNGIGVMLTNCYWSHRKLPFNNFRCSQWRNSRQNYISTWVNTHYQTNRTWWKYVYLNAYTWSIFRAGSAGAGPLLAQLRSIVYVWLCGEGALALSVYMSASHETAPHPLSAHMTRHSMRIFSLLPTVYMSFWHYYRHWLYRRF